jgi:hypothetical protein
MSEQESDETEHRDLARALAKNQHHHSKAIEEIATNGSNSEEYHLMQAFWALGDYLHGTDEWETHVPDEEDGDG